MHDEKVDSLQPASGARHLSRRPFVAGAPGVGLVLGGAIDAAAVVHRRRKPGSLPFRHLPEGTDTLPQIEHIIILMMENHSFDDHLGTLGRGDGFPLRRGLPAAGNPDVDGTPVHAFHMPSTCQLDGHPGQNWNASHTAFDGGRNDGFVRAGGPGAVGYWTAAKLPCDSVVPHTSP